MNAMEDSGRPIRSSMPSGHELSRFYRPELDALRFFAFLFVFIHHALMGGVPEGLFHEGSAIDRGMRSVLPLVADAGNFGMSLFFVLSAYLITQLLLLELDRTGTIKVKAFYTRRILRIWPLYFFFLALSAVLGAVFPATYHVSGARIAALSLLSGNWYMIAHGFGPLTVGVLWSISVEEQFYLVWPGLVFFGGGRRRILIATLAVEFIGLIAISLLANAKVTNLNIWLNSLTQFVFFALGAQLALYSSRRKIHWRNSIRLLAAAAGLGCWLVAVGNWHVMQRPDESIAAGHATIGYCLIAIGTAGMFLASFDMNEQSVPGWLRYLGKISYGLYIFHMLMLSLAFGLRAWITAHFRVPKLPLIGIKLSIPFVALALTVLTAAISYRWLESPFLRLRKRFTVVRSRPV